MDEKTMEAWHLFHKFLLPFQGAAGRLVALISERDAVPLSPFGGLSQEECMKLSNPNPIAREEFHRTLMKLDKDQKQHMIASAIKFTILVVAVMFALVTMVTLFQGGKVHIPGF